jgi:hypothetical protein
VAVTYELTKVFGLYTNEVNLPGSVVEVVLELVALTGATEKTVKIIKNSKRVTEILPLPFSTCK